MRTLNWFALSSLLLTACTWSHPYKTQQEFYADKMECQGYAQQMSPNIPATAPQNYANMTRNQMGATMGAATGQQMGASMGQAMGFSDCMKSKGYQ